MTIKYSDDWHGCPIRYGSAIFGDTWSMLILRDLMFKGARYYADFLNAGESISTNILAFRLAKLETDDVVQKTRDPDHGSRYIYTLTKKGLALVPVMLEIIAWAEKWDEQTEVPPDFSRDLRRDRKALQARIVSGLKNKPNL